MRENHPEPLLVSIGIPTYNRAGQLERAIKSVLTQDYKALEIIISDNGSVDGTEQLCRRAAERDGRIRYLRQPINRGPTENFRIVLREARGKFFMWLGDDDWLEPTYVSRCAAILLTDTSYGLVYGLDRYFKGTVLDCVGQRTDLNQDAPEDRVALYFRMVGRNGMFYGLMRRSLVSKVPMDECLGADWLMLAAMAFQGKIKMVDDTFVNRSIAGNSSEWSSLAAMFKLSDFQKTHPYLVIAANAFSDIGWRSPVYAGLGAVARMKLGTRVFRTIMQRFYSPRSALRLGGQLAGLPFSRWRRRENVVGTGR